MSLPDLWHTPPGLCAEEQCCRPSFVLSGPLYTTETSPSHPFADSHLYWPYQQCRMDNSDPYWSLVKWLSREQLLKWFWTLFTQNSRYTKYLKDVRRCHSPSSVISIRPWYSVWEGSTLRKGRITFPRNTVLLTSSPTPFTDKHRVVLLAWSKCY